MGFFVAIVVLGGAIYWIYQQSRKSEAECIALLGLSAVKRSATTHGQSAEGFDYVEHIVAEGQFQGLPAQLLARHIRSAGIARSKRNRGTLTVLSLQLPRPPPVTLRLQPVGVMRAAESFAGGAPEIVLTGDSDFDQAWHLYSARAEAAIIAVDTSLRTALMSLHRAALANGPSGVGNKLAAGLLLGSFELTETVARYYVVGTASAQTGERLKLAQPILARLC